MIRFIQIRSLSRFQLFDCLINSKTYSLDRRIRINSRLTFWLLSNPFEYICCAFDTLFTSSLSLYVRSVFCHQHSCTTGRMDLFVRSPNTSLPSYLHRIFKFKKSECVRLHRGAHSIYNTKSCFSIKYIAHIFVKHTPSVQRSTTIMIIMIIVTITIRSNGTLG